MPDEIVPGTPGEGQPDGSTAPADDGFQLPDKFKAETEKESLKKAVTSYQELEKELGKKGNSAQEIADIKNSLKELHSVIQGIKPQPEPSEYDPKLMDEHKQYLKAMGVPTMEDLQSAKEQGRKEAELDRINETLQERYNGKDGRPVYDRQALTDFAKQSGYTNLHPETVYKLMHEKELDDWKIKQALKGNRAPITPEGGKKPPKQGDEPDVSKMSDTDRIKHMTEKAKSYME